MLLDSGAHSYVSDALQQNIDGTKLSGAALPGWRFTRGGPTSPYLPVAWCGISPANPGSHLHELYAGGETAVDIWYQPNAMTMAAFNGAIGSIGPTGYVRGAIGVCVLDAAFIGPEIEEIWCGDFGELEFGAHLTGLRFHSVEWSMASGPALTWDRQSGPICGSA